MATDNTTIWSSLWPWHAGEPEERKTALAPTACSDGSRDFSRGPEADDSVCPLLSQIHGFGVAIVRRREIRAIGMLKNQRTHARFRLHHHAFRKFHADFFRTQQLPDPLLVVEIRARRIAEAVALAAVPRREAFLHGHAGRIGNAPVFADAAMQPFGAAFGRLDGQRLESV